MRWVRWITRVIRPFAAVVLLVLAACSDSLTDVPEAASVVFATDPFLDLSATWSGPLPLTVQQKTASGSWVTVLEVDGPLAVLATLPDGNYRIWSYDTPLGEFSVSRD